MRYKTAIFTIVAALGAGLGVVYSTFSTYDFANHLDRQLHTLNCSFLPGFSEETQLDDAAEGCQVAMFSPYSSMWRDRYWGGIPVSLFAMGLFGFAFVLAVWSLAVRRAHTWPVNAVLLVAALSAVGASLFFFWVSLSELNTVCKLCAGTYIGSAVLLVGAALAALTSRADRRVAAAAAAAAAPGPDGGAPPAPKRPWLAPLVSLGVMLAELGLAVLAPAVLYAAALPDYTPYVTGCETLARREDKAGVLLPLGRAGGSNDALLVLDPLCAACKAFHRRLGAAPGAREISPKVLLLPLDAECNWMISDSPHPGACLLSRALLCAGPETESVLEFIYAEQDELRAMGGRGEIAGIQDAIVRRFPNLQTCLVAPETKIKLNKTLQFAVANRLPLLTPQLFLNGRRLCDEDTDLGLDFALDRLLHPQQASARPAQRSGRGEVAP